MSIYVGTNEIKNVYIWTTPVKEVYVWTTKVRPKSTTFTISWTEQSNMSSWWTYSDDAAWLTAGSSAFDDFFWYSAVLLNTSGVKTAEMTQTWWTFTGAMTTLGNITSWDNVMIKFPVRWIKMTKSWSTVTLSITDWLGRESEWYQYYAHCTWTLSSPWTPKSAFYLWAYKAANNGSNVLKSWSGKTIEVSQTQATSCSRASANGTWYNIMWFYQRMYINALYMMKYWNPDCQSVVGKGYTWASSKTTTWWTNSQTYATYWTSSNATQCRLFWLEDWWGNADEWVWWMCTDGSKNLWTALSWYTWTITTSSPYQNTWTTIQTTSWFDLSSIAWNNKAMFATTGTVNNSSYSTYYCDYVPVNASSLASAGGSWAGSVYAGAFYLSVTQTASTASAGLGSRLMYL